MLKSADLKEFSRLCDHEMLNAILSRYKRQCSIKNIDFIVDIRNETTVFLPDSDLTSLFCNLLDNSIEAAEGIPDSYIEISILKKIPSEFVILSVINSYRNSSSTNNSHFPATRKTDKKKHGFGVKSIKKWKSITETYRCRSVYNTIYCIRSSGPVRAFLGQNRSHVCQQPQIFDPAEQKKGM